MSKDNLSNALAGANQVRTLTKGITDISQTLQRSATFGPQGKQLQNLVILIQDELSNIRVAVAGLETQNQIDKLEAFNMRLTDFLKESK